MQILDITLVVLYLLACAGLAWHMREKMKMFRQYKGFILLLLIGFTFIFAHNAIYDYLSKEDIFFFFIGFLCIGTGSFCFIFWLVSKIAALIKS